MTADPANIYEAEADNFSQETERLASFALPSQVSIDAIGDVTPGTTVLDIGAGPNTDLLRYVQSRHAHYTALDKNAGFLDKQGSAGAEAVLGDVRNLPFADASFDICHLRFVISHLGRDKLKAVKEAIRVTKSGGRTIFIEYDWATAHGSAAFEKVKDFMIHGGFLFDAAYGSTLESEVRQAVVASVLINTKQHAAPHMNDYSQVLKLREAGTTDLELQGKEESAARWNELLDTLQEESVISNPPGFFFPGITVVVTDRK